MLHRKPRSPCCPLLLTYGGGGQAHSVKKLIRRDVTARNVNTKLGLGARAAGVASDPDFQAFLEFEALQDKVVM